ncbi:hypothetical protein [Petroclostridium sp. X23]|uniref:hypothetical protein n=1 Tax=Petroclostridium sp. X23 TaxID=3045146 RepID=UPI0024AE3413|nr:hypothetical protein [Petroclostridium sp. X23]WHH60595.1 hypothetical protein QKW49_07770 [Petroclostridium sp. X23]
MNHRANIHGGNIYQAQEQYGVGIDQVLDYGANINPLGIPRSLQAVITDNMNILT